MMNSAKTILIIDDKQDNLRLLVNILKNQGIAVRPIRNAYQGLMIAQQERPDLILLDIQMPEIDGYEVCRRLKADEATRPIPVIFLSALDDTFDKVQAFQVGGVDYVAKPFVEIGFEFAPRKVRLFWRYCTIAPRFFIWSKISEWIQFGFAPVSYSAR